MARPVNADAGATRARILSCASGLFADRGAGQTSVRAIAHEAEVSLAMIHHYFGSKDELYQACVESMYLELSGLKTSLLQLIPQALDASLDRHSRESQFIEAIVRGGWQFAIVHRSALRLVMRNVIDEGEVPLARQEAFLLPLLDQAGAIFVEGTQRPLGLIRASLQGLIFMLVRYALSNDSELMTVTQAQSSQDALAQIENHLVQMAQSLLVLPLENK
jgi:AcrR family transcriptional regulator